MICVGFVNTTGLYWGVNMCGICGFISSQYEEMDNLIKMNSTLIHRGPDDHGEEIYQLDNRRYVGFAQRRLSIMDLSSKGHQPMHSENKRISVIFNGEIYNFMELKELMPDYMFRSSSDTEVIIAAYLKWGINFVNRLNGMFAIAIFDRKDDVVYLIRDRIGKKPLYYYVKDENNVAFASELKGINTLVSAAAYAKTTINTIFIENNETLEQIGAEPQTINLFIPLSLINRKY